jgi:hypothetical protein
MTAMALIHRATLRPTKLELLAEWLPGRDWHTGPVDEPARLAAYRFDDPVGEVGVETMLVRAGDGPVFQVPMTYRDAPLAGADAWLIGTCEHSVLGKRWVYDAVGDPVYAVALASAILAGTGQAEELVDTDGRLEPRAPTMTITSSASGPTPAVTAVLDARDGDPARITTGAVALAVVRRPGADLTGAVLSGTWPGQDTPVPLASASTAIL